ncbi:MAG TPA: O-antigen ligase family protein [Bryobacteraceae bacterium]|nr:O-antigen ligase family protein [Bryobacteraceae bacterium]
MTTAAAPRGLVLTSDELAARAYPGAVKLYVWLHCTWFALYALLGKGFAYAGYPPIYAGEVLLFFAVCAVFLTQRSAAPLLTPIGAIMVCFVAWQIMRMAPYVDVYGINAFRDSVLWAYAAFAWAVAAMMLRIRRPLHLVLTRYRKFARIYLVVGPATWLMTFYLSDKLPVWPHTTVTIPLIKAGDYAVQLAGIFAFSTLGLSGPNTAWWTAAAIVEGALGMTNRGGMVAFLSASALALAARPRVGKVVTVTAIAMTLIAAAGAFDVRFTPPGSTREVSVDMLTESLRSVITPTDSADLESTKGWRLNWWSHIIDYTIDGPYFWNGKGYGINLADSDGFQGGPTLEPLRSPHNSHLTFLARAGVPGFLLWVSLQLTWLASMARAYFRARFTSQYDWMALFAWITAFWLAFMINASFDVSLEGPMAGIPFWTVFGIGWASQMIFSSQMTALRVRSDDARR